MSAPLIVTTDKGAYHFVSVEALMEQYGKLAVRCERAEVERDGLRSRCTALAQDVQALEHALGEYTVDAKAYRIAEQHLTEVRVQVDTGMLRYAANPADVVMHRLVEPLREIVRMTENRLARKP